MTTTAQAWHLVRRPHGIPTDDDFSLDTSTLPAPGEGQVLVRNTFLSVDPYMRGRMNDVKSYVAPFALDEPMDGGAVGVVERVSGEARDGSDEELEVGDTVLHGSGWRSHALLDAAKTRRVDTQLAPAPSYLGVLGMPGLTAYVGLTRVAEFTEGDAVFVSGAAGAVGSLVVQIARLKGASRIIGSAGGPDKVRWLRDELGVDAAIDYKASPIRDGLREAAPHGIDVYFDNVGGDHLEAAISSLRTHGRAALCGAISSYNATEPPPGPRNLFMLVGKRITLRGFLVGDHNDLQPHFQAEVGQWLADGRIVWRETVVDGLEHAVDAFRDLLAGGNTGKMLVRL
jgi:NADPH-dependent curcumin reductase CurA